MELSFTLAVVPRHLDERTECSLELPHPFDSIKMSSTNSSLFLHVPLSMYGQHVPIFSMCG